MIGGDALLYYGADCGNGAVKLEMSGGAHSGSITVLGGGMNEPGAQAYDMGKILISDPADPTESMVRWVHESMESEGYSAGDIAKCKARKLPGTNDLWVVDELTNEEIASAQHNGYPRIACTQYGYLGDSNANWRIAQGFAWYVDFGQDAYQDFDLNSFTVITNTGGTWSPVVARSGAIPASQPATPTITDSVKNIAGGQEASYGEARGWAIYKGSRDGKFEYCVGERDYDSTKLRIGWDGKQWQFAVPYSVSPDYYGQFEVDGVVSQMSGTSDGQWAYAWIGKEELSAISKGNLMILDLARASLDFELIGTAAAQLKVRECFQKSQTESLKSQTESNDRSKQNVPSTNSDQASISGSACPRLDNYKSVNSSTVAQVEFHFTNFKEQNSSLYWVNFEGKPVEMTLITNQKTILSSYVGHNFIIKDSNGKCHGGAYQVTNNPTIFNVK